VKTRTKTVSARPIEQIDMARKKQELLKVQLTITLGKHSSAASWKKKQRIRAPHLSGQIGRAAHIRSIKHVLRQACREADLGAMDVVAEAALQQAAVKMRLTIITWSWQKITPHRGLLKVQAIRRHHAPFALWERLHVWPGGHFPKFWKTFI